MITHKNSKNIIEQLSVSKNLQVELIANQNWFVRLCYWGSHFGYCENKFPKVTCKIHLIFNNLAWTLDWQLLEAHVWEKKMLLEAHHDSSMTCKSVTTCFAVVCFRGRYGHVNCLLFCTLVSHVLAQWAHLICWKAVNYMTSCWKLNHTIHVPALNCVSSSCVLHQSAHIQGLGLSNMCKIWWLGIVMHGLLNSPWSEARISNRQCILFVFLVFADGGWSYRY